MLNVIPKTVKDSTLVRLVGCRRLYMGFQNFLVMGCYPLRNVLQLRWNGLSTAVGGGLSKR